VILQKRLKCYFIITFSSRILTCKYYFKENCIINLPHLLLVIRCDDVAASDNIGVLNGTPDWQKGSKSGSQYSRRSLNWRSPISSVRNRRPPELHHSRRMWVLGDQVVRDRRGMLGDRVVYTPPKGAHRRMIRKAYLKVFKRYKYGRWVICLSRSSRGWGYQMITP